MRDPQPEQCELCGGCCCCGCEIRPGSLLNNKKIMEISRLIKREEEEDGNSMEQLLRRRVSEI